MKRIFCIIFLLVLNYALNEASPAKFNIYVKGIKYWYDKSWGTGGCVLKTSREKRTGFLKCGGYLLKQVDYVYVQFQLFYRYGTIYHNYLFNYKQIEPCEMMKKKRSPKYSNPLADLVLAGVKKCCPLFNHECPYYPGYYNASEIDVNATVAPLLPPVVPAGYYKVYGRAFLDDNVTIGWAEGVGEVKPNHANRGGDFTMLAMG